MARFNRIVKVPSRGIIDDSVIAGEKAERAGLVNYYYGERRETSISVTAFLDSSGQSSDSFVTLAAFVTDDGTWAEFETGWKETLESGFRRVPYMHMKEAVYRGHLSPFSYKLGWNPKYIWELIFKLANYMSQFKGGRLTMHSCEVDMNAWRRLTVEGGTIPSEISLCNRYVSEYIVGLFAREILNASQSKAIVMSPENMLNFVFDRNERFVKPFSEKVNDEKCNAEQSGMHTIWQLVDTITEGEMKMTPGLQAADVLAWGINRQNTALAGREGKYLAHILKQIVMCTWKEYDEPTMRREFAG